MTLKPDLKLPEQKIASLSFCGASPKAFGNWVAHLPVANMGETSRQLYHAIIELNQLIIPPAQRLQLLELIRPRITFICQELSRHYLGLSIALPEKQRKIANLSQALQLHLAGGYKTVLIEQLDAGSLDKNRKIIATSCHRIISELSQTILRAHQLYCPSPAGSWLDCHRVYRFAQRNGLHNTRVADDNLTHPGGSTVADAYKRVALLGCARPNQLRQTELSTIYTLFEAWSPMTHCLDTVTEDSLFVVNLEKDAAPVYRNLLGGGINGDCFSIDTTELSDRLTEYLGQKASRSATSTDILPMTANASDTLLVHAVQALGVLTHRNFKRMAAQGAIEVAVGLTSAHYFIADETTFKHFVAGAAMDDDDGENLFLDRARRRNDAWAGAPDASPNNEIAASADAPITFRSANGSAQRDDAGHKRPRIYTAPLVNTSPGGYCINWTDDMPPALQTGEVLAIRERAGHPWSVALIRWIRQQRNQGTQLGIELLAPNATPCGVRLIQKIGNSSELLRSLLLPESAVTGQAATLITPRLPFQEGSRIELLEDGRENTGQLSQRLIATGSISRFTLRLQKQAAESGNSPGRTPEPANLDDEFNSLWPSL